MKVRPCVWSLIVLVAGGPAWAAGPAEYEQRQGPAVLRIGGVARDAEGRLVVPLSGKLTLTLTVDGPPVPERRVEPLKASPDWQVEAQPPQTEELDGDRVRWRQQFTLDPRQAGSLMLELLPLRLGNREVAWEPIAIQVTTEVAKADPKEARDVLPPEAPPGPERTSPPWLLWVGVAVGLVALALGGWELRRRLTAKPPPPSPPEWALKELDRIEALALPAAGETERYHTLLSDVVRRYLELRFRLPASRQTTAEFLQGMQSAPQLTAEQQALLGDFLQRCDLAKFARVTPPPAECQAIAVMARTFVQQTAAAVPAA